MKIENIKYPSCEFTHSDLAAFNGTSNQKIWQAYSAAREKGIIVPTGNKKGKATYYKLADPSKATAGVIPSTSPAPDKTESDEPKVKSTKSVPVISITPPVTPMIDTLRPVTVSASTVKTEDTEFKCPTCNTTMKSYVTSSGVMIFCPVKDLTVCKSTENPYGHGRNLKEAFTAACDKFKTYKHIDA
jgi:hypothetical protein